jgi:membrane fusion protein (multidrug efflux system)
VVNAFRRATIAAETIGRVVERQVEPGDVVDAGQALIALDATRLHLAVEQAEATLRTREIDLAEARRELERGDQLLGDDAISESHHDAQRFAVDRAKSAESLARVALRTTQRNLEDATVRAPFAGNVEEVRVDVGDLVSPGTPIATMVDLSRARIHAGVTSTEAAGLEPGTPAPVVLAELGGVAVEAEIHSVGRVADPASGTYTIELWLDSPDGLLREGMVAQVRLPMEAERRNPVVPRAALIRREGGVAVFVVDQNGGEPRAVVRPVRMGRSNAEKVELLEGVSVGEEVVVDGLFALRDGAPVLVERSSFFSSRSKD